MGNIVKLAFGRAKPGHALPKPKQCSECEEPIETARLQVNPSARRCIECERARERRHSRELQALRDKDIAIIKG